MRLTDRPTVEVETFMQAAPARVWELVTDLDGMGRWSPEYQGGTWLDGATEIAVGARFKGQNSRRDARWESVSTVVEAEPGHRFAWAVGDPENAGATWAFDLTTEGAGTRVRQRVELGPGPSGLTRRIDEIPDREEEVIAARMNELRRNMTSTLAAMKSVAEQPA